MVQKDEERRDTTVRNYSPQAYKFYMEQHVENVLKSHQQRQQRRIQLENEMAQVGLSEEAQCQMRRMLHKKESNYIRLKRAKMDKMHFDKIKTLGIGAFGEVALVRKKDTDQLYAMKTLRKSDVLRRNQANHVKAERDILAEADNEWVVKLYYSFQDKYNLYFVMDYIPGGDMMSLLIKFSIFKESLARFYIAELVSAIESVHKMGFIHRDIKPDNILIDKDGHIKLTDFGLCTGFRWTHNSKYYQKGEILYCKFSVKVKQTGVCYFYPKSVGSVRYIYYMSVVSVCYFYHQSVVRLASVAAFSQFGLCLHSMILLKYFHPFTKKVDEKKNVKNGEIWLMCITVPGKFNVKEAV